MKKIFMATLALVCAVALTSCDNGTKISKGNKSQMDTLSYCLGADYGTMIAMRMGDIPFNVEQMQKGFEEAAFDKANCTREEAIEEVRTFLTQTAFERRQKNAAIAADSTSTEQPVAMFENEEECNNISYKFGVDFGCGMREAGLPIQTYWFGLGLKEGFESNTQLDRQAIGTFLQHYFVVVYPQLQKEESEAWLEKVAKKSGVKKTESGLLYKVVKEGDMSKVAINDRDTVVVHYTGRTREGKVFDSSYYKNLPEARQKEMKAYFPDRFDENGDLKEDVPATFPLDHVIKGWTEGMKLVGPGGKIILYIPSDLAYGSRGAGPMVAPNAALEFEVELLEVKPFEELVPAEVAAEEEAKLAK